MATKDEDKQENENNSIYKIQAKALGIASENLAKTLTQESDQLLLGSATANAMNRPGNENMSSSIGQIGAEVLVPLAEVAHPTGLDSAISEPTTSALVDQKDVNATRKELQQQLSHRTALIAKSPEVRKMYESSLLSKGANDIEKLSLVKPSPSMGHTAKEEEEERTGVNLHR